MMMSKQRIALVTGGTGFIGSNLIAGLLAKGWVVHAIVRSRADLKALAGSAGTIQLHEHDGSTEGLVGILAEAKPDVVFHLASLFLSAHAPKDIVSLIQSNVLFSTQLLEAMIESGANNLINTGTSWQHYQNQACSPVNLYAATKQAFDAILQYYVEAKGLKAITLKLFDTYGPNDPRPKLFHLLEKVASTQERLEMSPGEQLIDLVYIDDVLAAYLLAAERLLLNKVGHQETYVITSGNPIKLKDLVEVYSRVIGKPLPVVWGSRPYRPREVMVPWHNGEILPGWEPKVSLAAGIARTEQNAVRTKL